jgi:hypothetical protein
MRSHTTTLVLALASTRGLAGCQQSDGPIPLKDEEITNRIEDVSHDLSNVSRGHQQAPAELTEDLVGFLNGAPGRDAAEELGRRLGKAVAGRKVTDETARKLAEGLWVAMAARELSERQRDEVLNQVRDLLSSVSVERADAEAVAAQAADVHQAISTRTRRWYERY